MRRLTIIMIGLLLAIRCLAATHYVVTNGTPGWIGAADPYTNWATAGTNIIDVVNAAMTNTTTRIVWVTNGTYYPTNVIVITNALTLKSVNGRDATILAGQGSLTTNRCLYNVGYDTIIDGFTVTNYYVVGQYGAVGSYVGGISILNCLFAGNSNVQATTEAEYGGGVYISGLTGYPTVTNCVFSNNYSYNGGAGLAISTVSSAKVENCVFYGNRISADYAVGGGACYFPASNLIISNCAVINNKSKLNGAGFYFPAPYTNNKILNCSLIGNIASGANYDGNSGGAIKCGGGSLLIANCVIVSNISPYFGGGVYGNGATIRNCLIAQNTATNGGGIWLTNSAIENCTIVSNYAKNYGGGLCMNGANCRGTNNIVYFNTAGTSANNFTNTAGNTGLHYSCVIPAVDGTRNITNDPSLLDLTGGNYRLSGTSLCVNAGLNANWMTNAVDLDGRSRIRYGTVDMGAYEVICGGTIYGFH